MHTITDLRRTLGVSTTNQVRNRIEAIKDLLSDHLRRGPNNQILVADPGVDLLRRLQELYDSGLTITEASDVLRTNVLRKVQLVGEPSACFVRNLASPEERADLVASLRDEIAFLRERVRELESRATHPSERPSREWWEPLKEETSGT
jgi:hypothetical protein